MEYGKPTAKKVSGCEWYLPAVTTPFGPAPLPHCAREGTRSKATSAARRALSGGAAQKALRNTTKDLAEIAELTDEFMGKSILEWLSKPN